MLLTKENIKNNVIKNTAGIYYIKNKLNNKYYIGQSINMRTRLLFHINRSKDITYLHIHRAINKDGIENFEFAIIAYIILDNKNEIKTKLDFLEKYYIRKYNCYGINGYNATIGGDKGVLGLIHTPEVKLHLKNIGYEKIKEKYNMPCWIYNIFNNEIKYLNHLYKIDKIIPKIRKCKILRLSISDNINNIHGYIFANTKKNLQKKIDYYSNNSYIKTKNNKIILNTFNSNCNKIEMSQITKRKIAMSHTKYIYCQYDLSYNLLNQYYHNDIKLNFKKEFLDIIRNKKVNEYNQIDNFIWCKKLISDI